MITLTTKTKAGRALIAADRNIGYDLDDVYKTWSTSKGFAMQSCKQRYANDALSYDFHIVSKTAQSFTVAWYTYNRKHKCRVYHRETAWSVTEVLIL